MKCQDTFGSPFYRITWSNHCFIWFFHPPCRYQTPPFHFGVNWLICFSKRNTPNVCLAPTKATLEENAVLNIFLMFSYRNLATPDPPIFAHLLLWTRLLQALIWDVDEGWQPGINKVFDGLPWKPYFQILFFISSNENWNIFAASVIGGEPGRK